MNKLLYALSVLLVLLLAGCNKEDDVHAELGDSWYDLKDDPSDPVQHYIYELYANTGVVLVVDPDIRDYRFNFTKKNNIRVVAPKQESDLLTQGIEFARKIFLDIYPDDFKKAYFPYNIILADSILFLGMEDQTPSYHAFASTNFVAIAGIRSGMENYTEEEISEIKSEVNGKFWNDYLAAVKGVFVFPEEFYGVSEEWYGKFWMDGETPDDIDCHEMGFVDFDWGNTSYDDDPIWGGWWVQVPGKDLDRSQWMTFMFNSTATEREELFARYPLMKQKYEILKNAMKACGGFDISKVN